MRSGVSGHSSPGTHANAPPLWLAALGAALALIGALLGNWQLERADANRVLRERFAAGATLPPLAFDGPPATLDDDLRYRRVRIAGEYVTEPQFLLDNRVRSGQVGYEVLTLFQPLSGEPWLLVNRGWLPADPDRRILPAIGVAGGERAVVGMLDRLPRAGLALEGAVPRPGAGPRAVSVVSFPTAADLAALAGRPLADLQLKLDEGEPDGFERAWEAPGLPPERNLAYAGQWFLLAAAAAAGAIWVVIAAVRRRKT